MSSDKVLLHACCAPCLTNSILELKEQGFDVTVYFYNPNIAPHVEYQKRLDELIGFCSRQNYPLIIKEGGFALWDEACTPLKDEKEGGARCAKCFDLRLAKTAQTAAEQGFEYFCTTLTISPHKNSTKINELGAKLSEKYSVKFLERNFKKNDGFKKSLLISKDFELFRQDYCGCKYSIRAEILSS